MGFWNPWRDEKPFTRDTRTILIVNSKGGSGKTTLATNLASYYADRGTAVALADFDPQGSSLAWLAARPDDRPPIHGLAAWQGLCRVPARIDTVIMDVAAGMRDGALARMMVRAHTILVPVLPSPMDIRAAADFFAHLERLHGRADIRAKLAVVANRVREQTCIAETLTAFLETLKHPFVAALRDSQHYIAAAERGLGLFELAPSTVADDLEQWQPLLAWLNGKRSLPKAA